MQNQFNLALQNNSLFKNTNITSLTLEDLNPKIVSLEEGEILFKDDDFADSIFLVIDGEINLLKKKTFSKTVTQIISPNEFFGQEEFFNQSKREYTAIAIRDTKVAQLSKDNLEVLIQQYNNVFNNLKDSLSDVDDSVIENLHKLFEERSKSNSNKASIFDLELNNETELKFLNETKKQKKTIDELKAKIERYHDLIRQKEHKITALYSRLEEYQNTHKQLTHLLDNQNEQLNRLLKGEESYKKDLESYHQCLIR